MARPSGLASDHHPEGPGDVPSRRRRGHRSTPSVDHAHANTTTVSTTPTASTSKRPASPSPEHASKRKRVHSDDHDQLAREVEESASRGRPHMSAVAVQKTVVRHARRNSEPVEPVVAFADHDEDEDEDEDKDEDAAQRTPTASTQLLPGLTPHLQRIGAPRGRPSNAARRARMSMPAQFHLEPVDEADGSRIQFAPFKATLDSRTRRRLKRNHLAAEINQLEHHEKEDKKLREAYKQLSKLLKDKNEQIKALEYQIEAQRLGEINLTDDETDTLRQQLSQAQAEIDGLRASSVYRGDSGEQSAYDAGLDGAMDDGDDDEPLLAIDPADPDGPDDEDIDILESGEYATRVQELSSQVTVETMRSLTQASHDTLAGASQTDNLSDQAIRRYENEIEQLVQHVAEAQGSLRITTLELQNLNVLRPGATLDMIIVELRHTFEAVREEMENLLPGITAGLNNSEFLRKLPTVFENLLSELAEKASSAQRYYEEARVMRSQYENALGLLERSESRNDGLDTKLANLTQDNESLRVQITELEERVSTLDELTNQQDADLKQNDMQIHALQDETQEKEITLTRLRDSLEKYRNDLDSVTETATRTEAEYQQMIVHLKEDHTAQLLELQTQLQDENELRLQAEGQAEQKTEYIEELTQNIQGIEEQVAVMTEGLETLRGRLATEVEAHDQTKAALGQEQDQTYALQNQIENMEEKLEELTIELNESRAELERERKVREATESLLTEANSQLEDLQERLRKEGLEAQGLRSKLFEVQVQRDETEKNLKEDAQARESALEQALSTEAQARETAQLTANDQSLQITQLESDLAAREDEIAHLTQELRETEKDRDTHVETLTTQLGELQQKHAALENSSNSTITTLQANITDLTNDVNALKARFDEATTQAAENERDLQEQLAVLGQQLVEKDRRIAERDAQFVQLEEEHTNAIEKFSMEQLTFNTLQERWARGQATMEAKIKAIAADLREKEAAAAQAKLDYEAALLDKDAEIKELRILGDERVVLIGKMESQVTELKNTFAQQALDTQETINKLLEAQRHALQQNQELAAELNKRNTATVEAVQAMKIKGVVVKAQNTSLNKVATGKVTKVSERVKVGKKGRKGAVKERKWRDSGFGADSDIENEDVGVELEEGVDAIVG